MSTNHTLGPLRDECMNLLEREEISAARLEPTCLGMVTLHNRDGGWLFRVTADISERDLQTMLDLHVQRFAAGERAAREQGFSALRALIGVDAAIAKAMGQS